MKIEDAMQLSVRDAAKDPSHLVPALPPSTKPTIEPAFGRPKPLRGRAAPAAPAERTAACTADRSAAGSSGGAAAGTPAPCVPSWAGSHEPLPVPGAGGMPGAATTVPAVCV